MSAALFILTAKKNTLLFVIFLSVLLMYVITMTNMYDPQDADALNSMMELLPPKMISAMGFAAVPTDLSGYLANWLYGMLMTAFPMVYCIILGNRLVAKMVDDSSMACLLSTPNSRVRIALTQGIYALLCVILLFAVIFGSTVAVCEAMFPGQLNIPNFLNLNITITLVNLTVMSICFFFSCLFSRSSMSLGFGAGISIVMYLMNMLGSASKDIEVLKKLSIYGQYDPIVLSQGTTEPGLNALFAVLSAALVAGGIIIFRKKPLAL